MRPDSLPRDHRKKAFYLVMALIFTDTALYGTIVPLIPIYMKQFHLTTSSIGVIFSAYALGVLIFSLPMGMMAEKYGYRRIFLSGMAALGFSCLAFGLMRYPWALFLCRFIQGAAAAASWTAGMAVAAVLYPRQQGEKIGLLMAAMGLGTILGPPIGGLLYHFLGYHLMFVVLALLCLLLIFFICRVNFPGIRINNSGRAKVSIFSTLADFRVLWVSVIVIALASIFCMLEILMPAHMDRYFGLDTVQIGFSFGVMGIAHAVSDTFSGHLSDRLGYERFIFGGLIANAVILPFLAWAPNIFSLLAVFILVGIAIGAAVTPSQPFMYQVVLEAVPEAADCGGAGCIYGFYNTLYSVGMFLGPLLGGLLNEHFSLLESLLVFSLIFLCSALLFYCKILLPKKEKKVC